MKNKASQVIFSFLLVLLLAVTTLAQTVLAQETTTQAEPIAPAADQPPAAEETTTINNETIPENITTDIPPSPPPPIPITVSITANPSAGVAPLAVQFIAAAAGQEPQTYAWDFNMDGTVDSTRQNPTTTFEEAREYNVTVTVTDATGNTGTKLIPITVTAFDSKLNISSFFPDSVTRGENRITFILINNGERVVEDITAKIVGNGVQQLSSTSISRLKPGDEDSLTVTVNVVQGGTRNVAFKVLDKSFPISFQVVQEIEYNKEELQAQFELLRQKMAEQEDIYVDKKAQNYLVAEVFESIKLAKKQLQDTQQQLLTNKLADAKVSMDLLSTAIDDIARNLEKATKVKLTLLQWVKENAIAVAAIIAALTTIGGILVKFKTHAQKVGETVKHKFESRKNGHTPPPDGQHLSPPEQHHPPVAEAPPVETKVTAPTMDTALEGKMGKKKVRKEVTQKGKKSAKHKVKKENPGAGDSPVEEEASGEDILG